MKDCLLAAGQLYQCAYPAYVYLSITLQAPKYNAVGAIRKGKLWRRGSSRQSQVLLYAKPPGRRTMAMIGSRTAARALDQGGQAKV